MKITIIPSACSRMEYGMITTTPPLCIWLIQQWAPRIYLNHLNITVLSLVFVYVVCAVISRGWTPKDIGVRRDMITWRIGLIYLAAIALGIVWFWSFGHFNPSSWNVNLSRLLLWSVIGVGIQEFLYRGFLMKAGEEVFGERSALNFVLNVILFTGMHFIFPNMEQKLIFIIPGAIAFTFLYYWFPNIIFISIVHMVFNAIAVLEGIFNV